MVSPSSFELLQAAAATSTTQATIAERRIREPTHFP
jgi:hypothetical protein